MNNTVFLVHLENSTEVFANKKSAMRFYNNEVKRLVNHKPDTSNGWSYKMLHNVESLTENAHYAIFEANLVCNKARNFVISIHEKPIRDQPIKTLQL